MHYFQERDSHRLLSRTENILPFFPQLQALFNDKILSPAKSILEDDVLVYKDKIIYKLPGSQGIPLPSDFSFPLPHPFPFPFVYALLMFLLDTFLFSSEYLLHCLLQFIFPPFLLLLKLKFPFLF